MISQTMFVSQVTSLNSMSGILEDALREYNETYATMDLVLFEDAMKHVRGHPDLPTLFLDKYFYHILRRPSLIPTCDRQKTSLLRSGDICVGFAVHT